jgi:hypothetical protein
LRLTECGNTTAPRPQVQISQTENSRAASALGQGPP